MPNGNQSGKESTVATAPKTLPWLNVDRPSAWYLIGDTREVLRSLPDNSVDMVLSSPPFFALRSYLPVEHEDKSREIGSEPTPAEFIDGLLDVTEECARVLTPTGSLCFELGDSFAASGGAGQPKFKQSRRRDRIAVPTRYRRSGPESASRDFAREAISKSLLLIPESFRWALVYGRNPLNGRETEQWRVRNVVRWHRPNPSVGMLSDKFRPATSEIVVACKSDKRWFDLDAVRTEPTSNGSGSSNGYAPKGQNPRMTLRTTNPGGAPPHDTWNIPTQPYKGSHYAAFPEELCRIPILSMCPKEVCRVCGEPRRRIVQSTNSVGKAHRHNRVMAERQDLPLASTHVPDVRETVTLGWTDCGHDDYRPGVILDPFGGTGTTAKEALAHGRSGVLIDIDKRNFDLARDRVGFWLQEFEVGE